MIILPAIDILGGKCVRLTRGEYGTASQVAADAVETALRFQKDGASYLHMVDLDGAKFGTRVNSAVYEAVLRKVQLPIELGGGIRNMETVEYYLSRGISRVILGTAALTDSEFLHRAVDKYGDRIAVGIDAMNEKVKTAGWIDDSGVHYIDFAKKMEAVGVSCVIFTDISKDGTLTGPNLQQLQKLSDSTKMNIIASGGIRCADDIRALAKMNLYGAICGKSLYSGTLSLPEAIAIAETASV